MIDSKLETLIAVSELGSYTKAAETLALTQPAVSQHIKALEGELGIKIFNRTENGIKPTPEGIIAIRYAKRIKNLYAMEMERIADSKKNMFLMTIGLTHSAENSSLIDALADFSSSDPSLRIKIVTDTINNLYEKLESYEVDMIVVEGRNTDSHYSSLLLDTDSLVVAASADSPLAKKSIITLPELQKEKLILRSENSGTRQLFEASLRSQGYFLESFNVILEVDSIRTIKDLIMKNVGVSILSRSACQTLESVGKLALLPIEGLPMIREVNLVYPKDFGHLEILDGIVRSYKKVMLRH
jgi:LysR family transcriptional regulator, transcriptional activator of the cysJI operon